VVGVVAAVAPARWGPWDQPAVVVAANYVEAVQRAGAVALVVPPHPADRARPADLVAALDGLVLTGGTDLDPRAYGAEPHPETDPPEPGRDAFEAALARAAVAAGVPVLGICRGMQVLNCAWGGTLHQHLPDHLGHDDHRRVIGTFDGTDHPVHVAPGSLAARAAGEDLHVVKSHHHQGVDRVGEGWLVTARADGDGLPEAIERADVPFALGVQWHPEADPESGVIAALVAAARATRPARRRS
jgi:putative glutamine amidotransferase